MLTGMDAVRVSALRVSLGQASGGHGWLERAGAFGAALRSSVGGSAAGGLLLVGTRRYEPWHLAAHLSDEAALSGLPALAPTLLRHTVPTGSPTHLSYGLRRLTDARRGATVLVVAPQTADGALLEGVQDARRGGATVFSLDTGDPDLTGLAHEQLTAPDAEEEPFDLLQHLVSTATATPRTRLSRLTALFTRPPVQHW